MQRLKRITGFEYYADPNARDEGFITWMVDGKPATRLGAKAMAADPEGSQVGDRLISEEPMSIIINLGISGMSTFLLFVIGGS